jgi:hypothetical protein
MWNLYLTVSNFILGWFYVFPSSASSSIFGVWNLVLIPEHCKPHFHIHPGSATHPPGSGKVVISIHEIVNRKKIFRQTYGYP